MIQLKHIKELDNKIRSALALIRTLRSENTKLRGELDRYQDRIDEMEALIQDFRQEQGAIEEGILRALKELDSLEDVITDVESDASDDTSEEASQDISHVTSHDEATPAPDSETDAESQDGAEPTADVVTEPLPETGVAEEESLTKDHDEVESEAVDKDDDDEEDGVDPPDTGESELDIF